MTTVSTRSFAQIRQALLAREEVALIDVREEAPFAEAHPLFAANIPLSKLELEVYARIPRRDTQVTLYDNGEGLAHRHAVPGRRRGPGLARQPGRCGGARCAAFR